MAKTRWLGIHTDLSLPNIANRLGARQFRRGETIGIELIEVKGMSVRGRFIEEFLDSEAFVDPFGDEIVNTVRRYSIFEFKIVPMAKGRYLLRLVSPPRSIKSFISVLAESFGFGFAVSMLQVDVFGLVQHLKDTSLQHRWVIRKILISSIRLTETSLAKIEVVSKFDAFKAIPDKIDLKNSIVEKVTLGTTSGGFERQVEVTSKGGISCDVELLEEITPRLQDYFSTLS